MSIDAGTAREGGIMNPQEANKDELTAAALAVLARMRTADADRIKLALELGKIVSQAKKQKKRGDYARWCSEKLGHQPSWVSAHRRLFEQREKIDDARRWAEENDHPWAKVYSVERLLKVVRDYDRSRSNAPPTEKKRARRQASNAMSVGELEAHFAALKTFAQALARRHGDKFAMSEIERIATRFHTHARQGERLTCGAPQVSVEGCSESKIEDRAIVDGPLASRASSDRSRIAWPIRTSKSSDTRSHRGAPGRTR
jgi:hypothetical protein